MKINYDVLKKILSKICKVLPDKIFLKLKFRYHLGYNLDLNNPKSFNEKLQWLKLYDRKQEYTQMVDKYEVRKYIKEALGEEYLIPLLGVYNSYDEIDFDAIPEQFVLKPNHTSGDVFICKNKHNINHDALKKEINRWLHREYYWLHREWPYKNVKPRVVCEQYILDESEYGLKDYKFMCFNGTVKCCFVCLNRNSASGLNMDIYDIDWNLILFKRKNHPNSGTVIKKPVNFEKMVIFAEKLSKDIPFVRVDFYETNGKLYFGEITFFPSSGFEGYTPESYDYLLGSWIELK